MMTNTNENPRQRYFHISILMLMMTSLSTYFFPWFRVTGILLENRTYSLGDMIFIQLENAEHIAQYMQPYMALLPILLLTIYLGRMILGKTSLVMYILSASSGFIMTGVTLSYIAVMRDMEADNLTLLWVINCQTVARTYVPYITIGVNLLLLILSVLGFLHYCRQGREEGDEEVDYDSDSLVEL